MSWPIKRKVAVLFPFRKDIWIYFFTSGGFLRVLPPRVLHPWCTSLLMESRQEDKMVFLPPNVWLMDSTIGPWFFSPLGREMQMSHHNFPLRSTKRASIPKNHPQISASTRLQKCRDTVCVKNSSAERGATALTSTCNGGGGGSKAAGISIGSHGCATSSLHHPALYWPYCTQLTRRGRDEDRPLERQEGSR